MNKNTIHIISRGKRWAIFKKGSKRALRIFDSKEEAIIEGTKFLQKGFDLFVHRTSGTVDFWKKAPSHLRQVA